MARAKTLDLAERVAAEVASTARRADLDRREREHGGLIPSDRVTEAKSRSAEGWGPYRPSVTRAELKDIRRGTFEDLDRVTLQRLYVDCGAAVRRFAPKWKRERALTLRNDALLILIRWPSHGEADPLDLGGTGGTPRRRDWLQRTDGTRGARWILTPRAWQALRAAVKQASRAGAEVELNAVESTEVPTEALDLARLVEDHQRETMAPTRLPDSAAPEIIAATMDIPLDAARAITARAFPAATTRDLAESWRISEGACKNALTRGARAVRERFPDPSDLLDALEDCSGAWQRDTERGAIIALIEYRDAERSADDTLDAVRDWRGATDALPMEARALLAAARVALARNGAPYGSERAELIARSVPRLMRAETRRARASAALGSRGSHLDGAHDSASLELLSRFSAPESASGE